MTRMMRGLAMPRIIRSHNACLTCRRNGTRCHSGLPTCTTCDGNGLECVQPISTICDDEDDAAAAATTDTKNPAIEPKTETYKDNRNTGDWWDTRPMSQKRDNSIPIPPKTATHNCHRQPAPAPVSGSASAPASGSGSVSGSVPVSGSAPVTAPGSALVPVPVPDYLARIKQRIYQSQQRRLEQTHGHVRRSVPFNSDVDKDHDYAAYYDYDFDNDSDVEQQAEDAQEQDNGTTSNGAINQRRRRLQGLPESLSWNPRIAEIYEVQCSWKGEGAPPLVSRLNDYFSYMRTHLSPLASPPVASLPPMLLPACDYAAYEILHYYSTRPSNYRIENVPDINPVNPKLLRLAYSNPLVMQLIIAQRVNHREVSSAILPTGESADRYFTDAIGKFGPKIDRYLAGHEEEMLPLTLGSMILSLVDMTRLDKVSQAYNHPTAAKAILDNLLTLPHDEICKNMPDFLLEYYIHNVSFACLAADPARAPQLPFMTQPLQDAITALVAKRYHGKLCGSWLTILAIIPLIFRLGTILHQARANPSTAYWPNFNVEFGKVQCWLVNFNPRSSKALDLVSHSMSILFKNAAMLYLLSLLDSPHRQVPVGLYKNFRDKALLNVHRLLSYIPQDATINVALCWPLLVIGCCTPDKSLQGLIRQRLVDIAGRFGVGNALETLFILQHVWTLPLDKRSPWRISQYIENTKCWACSCPKCIPSIF
ncbi:hypothetical protein ACHAQJ_002499 [Trichoderma viride]